MAGVGPLVRTPFYFVGPRPYREAELAAYIRRQHQRGRRLDAILNDPYVACCGGPSVARAVLRRPELVRALGRDSTEAIRRLQAELRRGEGERPTGDGRPG
jgi:hypothetical protein